MNGIRNLTFAACVWFALPASAAGDEDVAKLLEGVTAINDSGGAPGHLAIYGPNAKAVVVGGNEVPGVVVGCSNLGRGRVVAFAHGSYVHPEVLDKQQTAKLFVNALRWSADNDSPRVGVFGIEGLPDWLKRRRFQVVSLEGDDWHRKLMNVDVLVLQAWAIDNDERLAAVRNRISRGAGLIIADTGWGWLQGHPDKTLTADHFGNKLLRPAGVLWTNRITEATIENGYSAGKVPAADYHAGVALDSLIRAASGAGGGDGDTPKTKIKFKVKKNKAAQAAGGSGGSRARSIVAAAFSVLPPDDTFLMPRLLAARDAGASVIPTKEAPVKYADRAKAAKVTLDTVIAEVLPPDQLKAHPAAATFPGSVPASAALLFEEVRINTGVPDWRSTGLYAPPGKTVTVTVPDKAVGQGLVIRIGCHSDSLWGAEGDEWRRMPEVCRRFPVTTRDTKVANAFGGLLYIEVPEECKLGVITVGFHGIVHAPRFVLGRTTREDWINTQSKNPGPWAEFESDRIILTLPSKAVRNLRNPVMAMQLWNRALDACADLAGIPHQRKRPERFVLDEQIGGGYMHSGYPIMAHLDVEDTLVNPEAILARKVGGIWGFFHEVGHNHQEDTWTFDGLGEVTVNLFTMYVFEKVLNDADAGLGMHQLATPQERQAKIKEFLGSGITYEKWDEKPFEILLMYVQLKEAFGWESLQKVFAEYRALPEDQRPQTQEQKRDQWLIRMSRTVNRNLGPFFTAWGLPTSDEARRQVARLPRWMPANFPPK